jgi:putative transcriptional regulator
MARRRAFGTVVRTKRKALGLSQEKLARRAGIDRQSTNRYENAQFSPSLDTVWDLAIALEMNVDELMSAARALLTPEVQELLETVPDVTE